MVWRVLAGLLFESPFPHLLSAIWAILSSEYERTSYSLIELKPILKPIGRDKMRPGGTDPWLEDWPSWRGTPRLERLRTTRRRNSSESLPARRAADVMGWHDRPLTRVRLAKHHIN